MTSITKQHILTTLEKGQRLDGRKLDEYREVTIEYGISSKSAEGSARVKIGKTEVVAGVKMEIGTPYSDKLDEGTIMVNIELLPLSNPDFESGPPSIESIELSRVIDRAIREGHAIDFKKLCIRSGEKMWMVVIDLYPINDAGNLYDAGALAAIGAIKDVKFPKLQDDKIIYGELTNKKLPLGPVPISCTLIKIGDKILVDPTLKEWEVADARLTMGMLEDGTLCSLQKGGDTPLTIEEIDQMVGIATKKTKELRKVLK